MSDWDDSRLTEARNPRTRHVDRASTREIVGLIQAEDRRVPEAVAREAEEITELVDRVVERFRRGGRLFYVGAGTSGRLGVLDAAECPPTFGTDPQLVQGIIAGGRETLVRSREGVEDDRDAGREDVREAGVSGRDFVLGIATSGTTPYVQAAVEEAAALGAGTGFLSCTEPPERVREAADVLVTPLVGPEVITGSTRMKAGTATKLVLNTLTTAAMVRLGKVYENLMVDLQAVSRKLVDRSLRIVRAVCGVSEREARGLVRGAGGSVKTALAMHELGVSRAVAERVLDACGGFLGRALDRYGDADRVPYYACYPERPESDEARERLLERLSGDPGRVREAVEDAEEPEDGWGASEHVAHVLEFEEEGVRPRIDGVRRGRTEFPDFSPSEPPPRGDEPAPRLLEELGEARAETLDRLRDDPPEGLLERRLAVGGEEMTLYQFLRGVAQHAEAHADRITERLHPDLRSEEDEGGAARPRAGEEPRPAGERGPAAGAGS